MSAASRVRCGLLNGALGRVLWAAAVVFAPGAVYAAILGPYVSYVDRVSPCPTSPGVDAAILYMQPSKYDVRKQNIPQRVSGNMTVHPVSKVVFDNTFWVKATMDSTLHAHWSDNAFTFNFPERACENLRRHLPMAFATLFKQDIDAKTPCRVPPGVYAWDNLIVNWTTPKFPVMPYGVWNFRITAGQNKTTSFCQNFECRTVPKSK